MNYTNATCISVRIARVLVLLGVLCSASTWHSIASANTPAAQPAADSTVFLPLTTNFPNKEPIFGVQVDEGDRVSDSAITGMSDLGAGWLRLGAIRWRELQPKENGPIQWNSDIDSAFRRLARIGGKVDAIVFDYPSWATTKKQNCSAIRPDKYKAFASFMQQVINRYKTSEYNVHNWELGNEVDIDPRFYSESTPSALGCWGNIDDTDFYGGKAYGEMLKAVVPSMRAADSQIKIWHGGLLLDKPNTTDPTKGKPERFLNGVLAAGGGDYFDILPVHAYTYYNNQPMDYDTDQNSPWVGIAGANSITVGKVRFVKNILQVYGKSKPVFVNEVALLCASCPEGFDRVSDQFYKMQSVFIVRAYTRLLAEGVAGVTWFSLTGYWRHSFLLDGQGPTPAYGSYKQLIAQLRYGTFKNNPNYGGNISAWSFSKGGNVETQVIWTDATNAPTISIPRSQLISATAMDGSPLPLTAVGDRYQIPVTLEPIYVDVSSS